MSYEQNYDGGGKKSGRKKSHGSKKGHHSRGRKNQEYYNKKSVGDPNTPLNKKRVGEYIKINRSKFPKLDTIQENEDDLDKLLKDIAERSQMNMDQRMKKFGTGTFKSHVKGDIDAAYKKYEKEGKYYRIKDPLHTELQYLPIRVLDKNDTNISVKAQSLKKNRKMYFKILDKNARGKYFKIDENGKKIYIGEDEYNNYKNINGPSEGWHNTITYHKIDTGKTKHGIDVDEYPLKEVEYVFNENWNGGGKWAYFGYPYITIGNGYYFTHLYTSDEFTLDEQLGGFKSSEGNLYYTNRTDLIYFKLSDKGQPIDILSEDKYIRKISPTDEQLENMMNNFCSYFKNDKNLCKNDGRCAWDDKGNKGNKGNQCISIPTLEKREDQRKFAKERDEQVEKERQESMRKNLPSKDQKDGEQYPEADPNMFDNQNATQVTNDLDNASKERDQFLAKWKKEAQRNCQGDGSCEKRSMDWQKKKHDKQKKAEEQKMAAEKKAEEQKIEAQKKAEEQKIEAQKKAEEQKIAAEAEAKKREADEAIKIAEEKKKKDDEDAKKKEEEAQKEIERKKKEQEEASKKAAEDARIESVKKAQEEKEQAEKKRQQDEEEAKKIEDENERKKKEEEAKAVEEEAKKKADEDRKEEEKKIDEQRKAEEEEAKKAAEEEQKAAESQRQQDEAKAKKAEDEAKKAAEEDKKEAERIRKQDEEAAAKKAQEEQDAAAKKAQEEKAEIEMDWIQILKTKPKSYFKWFSVKV
jgi:hypothetical protein